MKLSVVLEFYRARWQVELAFKRLKSLLQMGQLPKKKEASCRAWMQGKTLTACSSSDCCVRHVGCAPARPGLTAVGSLGKRRGKPTCRVFGSPAGRFGLRVRMQTRSEAIWFLKSWYCHRSWHSIHLDGSSYSRHRGSRPSRRSWSHDCRNASPTRPASSRACPT